MALAFRRALVPDVPELARIYNEAVLERIATADLEPRSLEERKEWFGQFDDRHPIWVGEESGRVVCYGALFKYSTKEGYRFATENSLYVSRDARGRGHGRAMLGHLLENARLLGFSYMLARIFTHNETSVRLHAERGFRTLGVQRRIVEMDGRWYDVTLMDINI